MPVQGNQKNCLVPYLNRKKNTPAPVREETITCVVVILVYLIISENGILFMVFSLSQHKR